MVLGMMWQRFLKAIFQLSFSISFVFWHFSSIMIGMTLFKLAFVPREIYENETWVIYVSLSRWPFSSALVQFGPNQFGPVWFRLFQFSPASLQPQFSSTLVSSAPDHFNPCSIRPFSIHPLLTSAMHYFTPCSLHHSISSAPFILGIIISDIPQFM